MYIEICTAKILCTYRYTKFTTIYIFLQAPEQVDRRQLKHKGELNPALHEYRMNHLAQELQRTSQQPQPFSLNSPSTPALGPSQFLELLTNAMSSGSSGNKKESSKALKDVSSDTTKQFSANTHEHATNVGGSGGGVATAMHIKQEGRVSDQSSKSHQGQGSKSTLTTTPHSSPGSGGSLEKLKILERPKSDNSNGCSGGVPDTPLTHFRSGGKPIATAAFVTGSSSSSGQRTMSNSGGSGCSNGSSHHPLLASSTVSSAAIKSEDQSSGQQASAQTANTHVRTKGPVTRSTVRASSPSTCGDGLPMVSGSPSSEKNAKLAEKLHGGLSSEEARKHRQAQQKLQKEQWMKKYGQGTKRTLEMQQSGGAGSSSGDGGRQMPQSNVDTGIDAMMENGVLISDGKINGKL